MIGALRVAFLACVVLVAAGWGSSGVQINHDSQDCAMGWLSMDVVVSVHGEQFKFDPSCSFSYSDSFTTKKKIKCKIESGMCSGFLPAQRIDVSCDDGGSSSVSFQCKKS
jgi:hypothetical protein